MVDHQEALVALKALIMIAGANFPSNCDITISTVGKNRASITMPDYVLLSLLIKDES